jgi:hypothetical protein
MQGRRAVGWAEQSDAQQRDCIITKVYIKIFLN